MKAEELSAEVKYKHPWVVAWAAWLSAVTRRGWFLEAAVRRCLKVSGSVIKEVRVELDPAGEETERNPRWWVDQQLSNLLGVPVTELSTIPIVVLTQAEAVREAQQQLNGVYLTRETRGGICYYGVWQGTGGNPRSSLFEVNNNLRALCPFLYAEALGTAMAVAQWEGLPVRDLTREQGGGQ
jgi:hypothetical protein